MRQVTILDRSEMRVALRWRLGMDLAPVILVDAHPDHLDPEVAIQLVASEEARRVREILARLVRGARELGVIVVHVVMTYRRILYPGAESMSDPFWRAREAARQSLTPGQPNTIFGHNLEDSPRPKSSPS